jgi:hypothetical protein
LLEGLADDGDGGLGVGLAGGGGYRQPQPVAHRSDQPRLGLSRCSSGRSLAWAAWPAEGGLPASGSSWLSWSVAVRSPDAPQARQGALGGLLGVPARAPPPRRAAWEGLLARQERACAAIARALARQPSKICVPRPFEDESMHYRLSVSS